MEVLVNSLAIGTGMKQRYVQQRNLNRSCYINGPYDPARNAFVSDCKDTSLKKKYESERKICLSPNDCYPPLSVLISYYLLLN